MKRFLLWEFSRGSWQYDIVVALILAFIFLTPREIFRDQPHASSIVRLPEQVGGSVFWMEPELLMSIPDGGQNAEAAKMLKAKFGKTETVLRVEPIFDNDHALKGYMAFTKP